MKKHSSLRYVIFLFLFLFVASIGAQNLSTLSDSQILSEAEKYYKEFSYKKAVERFEEIIRRGNSSAEIMLKAADCYYHLRDENKAAFHLTELIKNHSDTIHAARAHHKIALIKSRSYYTQNEAQGHLAKVWQYCKNNPTFLTEYTALLKEQLEYFAQRNQRIMMFMNDILENYIDDMRLSKEQYSFAMYSRGMIFYRIGKNVDELDYRKRHEWFSKGKNFYLAKDVWEKLLSKYSDTEYSEKMIYLIGSGFIRMGKFLDGKKYLNKLIKEYPRSAYQDNAKRIVHDTERPVLAMRTNKPYSSGETGKITVSTRNIKKIQFTLYKINLLELVKKAGVNHNFNSVHFFQSLNLSSYERIKKWEFKTRDDSDHVPVSSEMDIDVTKAGSYLVEAITGNIRGLVLYVVSDISLMTRTGSNKILAYVVNGKTSVPVKDAQVYVNLNLSGPQYWNEIKTKENGIAAFPLPETQSINHSVAARHGDHYALSQSYYYFYYYYSQVNNTNYTYSDRPVYRPGQKVYLKGVLRKMSAGLFIPVTSANTMMTITDPFGQKVLEKQLEVSENGTYHIDFVLKADCKLGRYDIQVSVDGQAIYYYQNLGYRPYIQVEEYKRPEYEVKVSTVQQSFVLGDKITAKVYSKYYHGQPVKNAEAVVSVVKRWAPGNIPYTLYRKYYERFRYHFYSMLRGQRNIIAKTEKTDESGNIYLDFPTELETNIPQEVQQYIIYTYSVIAQVTDASRRQINGTYQFHIGLTDFRISAEAQRSVYTKGDKINVAFKTVSTAGIPLSRPLNIEISSIAFRNDEMVKTVIRKMKIKTNEDGEYVFRDTIQTEGFIQVEATGYDKKQNVVKGTATFWSVSENFQGSYYRYRGIEMVTDKKVYKPGDKMKVLVNTEHKGSHFLLTVEGKTLYDYKVVQVQGNAKLVEFDVQTSWSPNVFLGVHTIKDHKIYSETTKVIVPPIHHYITVKLDFKKREYLPGEKAYVNVTTLDWQGKPVSAEVTLSIFDRSLLYIHPYIAPDIRQFYYGRQAANQVRTNTSYSFSDSGKIHFLRPEPEVHYQIITEPSLFGFSAGYFAFGGSYYHGAQRFRSGGSPGAPEMAAPTAQADSEESRASRRQEAPRERERTDDGTTGRDAAPVIRTDFSETILWKPKVITNEQGKARVEFKFADSLTTWEVLARAVSSPTQVGETIENVITTKKIIVRLQSPRFFTERDRSYVSAIAHNYFKTEKKIKIQIRAEGKGKIQGITEKTVQVAAGGEYRADFEFRATEAGKTKITVYALTSEESDAMQKQFDILAYGSDRFVAWNGEITGTGVTGRKRFNINIPAARNKASTNLRIVVTPSIAMSMLDALPYLIGYPYGCVEQTLSRFLPSVMVKKALVELGIPPDTLKKKINPEELDKMVQQGLKRLYDFQHSSGGWGWWKNDNDNNLMTSLVVFGLIQAKNAGYIIETSRLASAINYLKNAVKTEENFHLKALMLYALSFIKETVDKPLKEVYEKRNKLTIYSMSLLAMTLKNLERTEQAKTLVRNLEDYAKVRGNQAWWGRYQGYYEWFDDAVETTASVVKAFSNIQPNHPILNKAVRWLVNNRRGMNWKSTKDTAAVVYAFIDYIKVRKELFKNYSLQITFNGRNLTRQNLAGYQILAMNNVFEVPKTWMRDGANTLVIQKSGIGTTYYSVFLDYFTKEQKIKRAGNLIYITREHIRLKPETDGTRVTYKRLPWTGTVHSGDIIEVSLKIKANNDFSYLLIEDPKPAGCEYLQVQSGTTYYSHVEYRDTRLAVFLSYLRQGTYTLTYRMRAETPGDFSQMPSRIGSMYVPEFRGTSDSDSVTISEIR